MSRFHIDDKTLQRIEKLRKEGLTWPEIAERVGFSVDAIRGKLRKAKKAA